MPRATDLALRLALDRMARLGATAPEIARQLDLPLSTVRGLLRRALGAGDGRPPEALLPRYQACGPRPEAEPPLLEAVSELRRRHPRWGAGRIRVELIRDGHAAAPSVRTIQRRLLRAGLAPAPPGRRRAASRARAAQPHEVWEVDAADQKRLADGRLISWLRVVDECSGAVLHSRVFPPGATSPKSRPARCRTSCAAASRAGAGRRRCGWTTATPGARGATCRRRWRCGWWGWGRA